MFEFFNEAMVLSLSELNIIMDVKIENLIIETHIKEVGDLILLKVTDYHTNLNNYRKYNSC